MKRFFSVLTVCCLLALGSAALAESGPFTPGAYSGEAEGFNGPVRVTLTVDDHAITALEFASDETPGIGAKAREVFAEAYVGQADANAVDMYSGATYTSRAAREAIAQALEQARWAEREYIALNPVDATLKKQFTPGMYGASAKGFAGDVSLLLTVDETGIVALDIMADETPGIGEKAVEHLSEALIGAADAGEADGWSGATITSIAVKEAVNKALDMARKADLPGSEAPEAPEDTGDGFVLDFILREANAANLDTINATLGRLPGLRQLRIEGGGGFVVPGDPLTIALDGFRVRALQGAEDGAVYEIAARVFSHDLTHGAAMKQLEAEFAASAPESIVRCDGAAYSVYFIICRKP